MNRFKLFTKSLFYYWKINLASVLAAALCVTIITGALIIGDSVKFSLNQIGEQRLGKTSIVLTSGGKLIRQELAYDLSEKLNTKTTALLQARGIALTTNSELAANQVQIIGIDSLFKSFSPGSINPELPAFDEIYMNQKLAEKLRLQPDDLMLVKIEKHNHVPLNSPFISTERQFVSLFATVKKVLSNEEFGRFSLQNNQVSPYNIFLNINQLNKLLEIEDAANIILIEKENLNISELNSSLKKVWQLEDASLSISQIENTDEIEILSNQIFINEPIINAVDNAEIIFTYLVNSIEHGGKATPYSFVSSIQSLNLLENEIIINRWLADDLGASINDTIALKYYTVGPLRKLTESSKTFVVKEIVSIKDFAADKSFMPNFPGLANVDNCRDWDAGVSINLDKVRDKDEKYWDDFGGTPKAFISYTIAREIWANEFGEATAIRIQNSDITTDSLGSEILANLNPTSIGLQFIPIKEQGRTAAKNSVDFGQLFLGMSFFILIAALLLIGLFFHLNAEYRNKEMGLYLALGFKKKSISRIWLYEGIIIILLGGIIGLFGAIYYNKLLLNAINTIWIDMVKTNLLFIKIYSTTLAIGFASGAICAYVSLYISVRKKLKESIVWLQKNITQLSFKRATEKRFVSKIVFYTSVLLALVIIACYLLGLIPDLSIVFFVSGLLFLLIGVSGFSLILNKKLSVQQTNNLSFLNLCTSNLTRNRKRSLLIVGMLAIGVYLVISTGANRQYMVIDTEDTNSGTGGFLHYAQTTLPVIDDLNNDENKTKYGLEQTDSLDLQILQFSTLDGDEASCFNLNQIQQPRLLGVDYEKLAEIDAFSFAKTIDRVDQKNAWNSLDLNLGENSFPVIADQTVIQWSFGKQLGDTLLFQKENGDTVNLILVAGLKNSIFQGNLLMSKTVFRELYPSVAGSKVFLVNGKSDYNQEIQDILNRNFRDYGIEITDTGERLASFYSVQNTYLNVFVLLGGIGLIIGTLGIGILIFRSVLERKQELAILRAIGFSRTKILRLLQSEHTILLIAGIAVGTISAVLSTLPSFIASGTQVPVQLISLMMALLLAFGLLVVFLSIALSTKKNLVEVLKSE